MRNAFSSPHRNADTTTPVLLPLQVRNLVFRAEQSTLIDRISFTLPADTCTIILGPNGAGKSLLLRLCNGLLQPDSGTIDWAGQTPSQVRHQLGMVFQRPILLRRSAAANIAYALSVQGIRGRERQHRVAAALARTELSHLAQRPARVLSGGEQQRLAIARAWATQPQIMFMDEPTANLDPAATRSVEQLVAAIRETGTNVVMTTHDLGQARRLADRILFLHRGQLLEHTPADIFFEQPRSPQAAAFVRGELLD